MNDRSSYGQVLRASSIIGGANGLNYLISLVRIKIVAVLLGPAGIGLVSLYSSAIGLVGTASGLGIGSSGVREVALAYSQQDTAAIARTVRILRRACWATGLLGWALAVALAPLISDWMSNSSEHAVAIAILGATVFLGAINGGQTALMQGARRIGDIARASIAATLFNTGIAIGLYAWLGQRGIVPVLVVTAAVSLAVSWWFTRRVPVVAVTLSWPDTWVGTRRLAGLGMAFMWSALLTAGLDIATRLLITRELGINAAGLYQAAWALSGIFASFILSAMGTDFYPRLTGAIHDHMLASRTVNEQTEIGMLLALPGMLGTLAFAPWLMEIFYTREFLPAAVLLPWFVLGIFGRVVSWPLGYVQIATGASRWFVATETIFVGLQLGLLLWFVPLFGLIGVAYTFAITYLLHTIVGYWVARQLINFHWTKGVVAIIKGIAAFVFLGFLNQMIVSGWPRYVLGGILMIIGFMYSASQLLEKMEPESKIHKFISNFIAVKWLIRKK